MAADVDFDWETYDALEDEIEGKPTGLLLAILPSSLYNLFFGPRPPTPDTVADRREKASKAYLRIISTHRSICESVSVSRGSSPKGPPQGELIIDFEHPSSNVPSFEIVDATDNDLKRYLHTLKTNVNRVEELRTEIELLIEREIRRYLRADEQKQLEIAQQTLNAYLKKLTSKQKQIQTAQFTRKINQSKDSLEELKTKMAPYLSYEEREIESGLDESLNKIQEQLVAAKQNIGTSLLPDSQVTELERIEQQVSELTNHLQGYQQAYLDHHFSESVDKLDNEIQDLQYALTPAKAQGQPIHREAELRDQIVTIRNTIADLREYPFGNSTLNSLQSRTDTIEAYIDAKTRFDTHIYSVKSEVLSLQRTASPYLNFEEYLTEPERSRIEEMLETSSSTLQTVRNNVDLNQLSAPDKERFAEASDTISEVEECLKDYNEVFITLERDRYKSLFTDIGPNKLNLTPEQQRAVIRNGIYNQVIAAAGTGKTLTLTTRVAYLIESQGIDPNDILVVTYTGKATTEMSDRLRDHFGITDVTVKTVHAFGYGLVQEAQDGFIESIDSNEQRNFIDQQIREARNDESSTFLNHYYEFLVHFDDVYHDETDFETREAYVKARLDQTYVTLKGTEVKSRAEKLIADFLFTHQIEYQYEARATWADSASDKAGYTPDFYLPNHDIYIEHWGIDESGSVAPWFSQTSKEYREKIHWGRQQFTDTEYTLIGTYEFEHEANQLKQVLRHRLTHNGVVLDQMGFEELVDTAFEYDSREGWIKGRFKNFIENAKRYELKPPDINSQLSKQNPRQYHFGQCGIYLLKQYVLYLTGNRLIDFQDMVHNAVESIQKNPKPYKEEYEHLLVDEFQDVGKGTLKLIQELTGDDAARLYAVGDDWQSIYSFQGAVIDYFTEFTTYFGEPVRTDLTANFRSPQTVVEAGNHLIENNSNQLGKTVHATIDQEITPRVHVLRGYQFYDYVRRVRRYTVDLVREYIAAGAEPSEIMVLCRYDGAVLYLDEIKNGLKSQQIPYVGKSDKYRGPNGSEENGVSVYSLYQAKGLEADHVIFVHAAEGPYGIPSNRREDELLDPVKPLSLGGIEEERRAFYVAMTRTEQTLDFLTRGGSKSRFLEEIDEYTDTIDAGLVEPLEDVGELMTVTVEVEQLLDPWTKQHQRGIVTDPYGGSARFVSWASTDPPTLKEHDWYRLSGLKVSTFKNEKELVWTADSAANHLSGAPSVTKLTQGDTDMDEQSVTDTKSSVTDTTESSLTGPAEPLTNTTNLRNAQPNDSVTNHQMFREVLSVLADLGGTASTAQITTNMDISRIGAFDRLRTLEAEGKVTQTDDSETETWTLSD